MEQSYQYAPLNRGGEIRLLTIRPGPQTQPIQSSISHALLDEKPIYKALSYTWQLSDKPQDASTKFHIICSNRELQVSANLSAALQHLRHQTLEQVFWIDAICIDQGNNQERGEQVRLMRLVYSQAEQVMVWLGEEEPTDELAISTIYQLCTYFENYGEAPDYNLDLRQPGRSGLPHLESPAWGAIAAIFRKRWFWRVWVIQEVAVATSILVMIGNRVLDWDMVAQLAWNLKISHLSMMIEGRGGGQCFIFANTVSQIKEFIEEDGRFDVSDLLTISRKFNATDPRDYLYGMFGLTQDTGEAIAQPDYDSSVGKIFTEAAVHCLTSDDPFVFLSFAEGPVSILEDGLPSWALDWSRIPWTLNTFSQCAKSFNAMSTMGRSTFFSENNTVFCIRGLQLDEIENISSPFPVSTNALEGPKRHLDSCRAARTWLNQCEAIAGDAISLYEHTGQPFIEAYWRSLICNTIGTGQTAPASYGACYEAFTEVSKACYQSAGFPPPGPERNRILERSLVGAPYEQVLDIWRNNLVFGTTTKGYLGMFPD